MKRKPTMSLALLLVLILVGAAMAASVTTRVVMIPDGSGGYIPIQQHASNGKDAVNLTVNSTTKNFIGKTSWELYAPSSGCKFRNMSTLTKAGLQRTWPNGVRQSHFINPATPYANFSGCTAAELDDM